MKSDRTYPTGVGSFGTLSSGKVVLRLETVEVNEPTLFRYMHDYRELVWGENDDHPFREARVGCVMTDFYGVHLVEMICVQLKNSMSNFRRVTHSDWGGCPFRRFAA